MIAGTLEIQLLADIARLRADMDRATQAVDGAMGKINAAVNVAKAAFAGLAGALSVGAFASMIKGSIDAAAGLHDMSIQTGASVASLMALKSVASTTDTTISGIAGAMNKFAKTMASSDEESKGAAQTIKALGLDFDKLKKMSPETQMIAVAKAFDKFSDGAGKSAGAMYLYGKEGAKMLPFLKDLADQSEEVEKKLTDQEKAIKKSQAAMADDFGDNLIKIRKASEGWKKELAMGMLPALVDASDAFLKAASSANGLNNAIAKLSKDGSIEAWTRGVISAIEPVAKVVAAYFGIFVVAPIAITAATAALTTLYGVIGTMAVGMLTGSASAITLNTALFGTSVSAELAAGSLTKMRLAGSVLFAAFAGWEIGTWLRDNFVEARVAGLSFVGVMLTGWENVKYAGEMAWEGVKYAFEASIGIMKSGFAEYLTSVASGLSFVGAKDTANEVNAYADSLRQAASSQKSFKEQTAGITDAHQKAIAAIDTNIVEMVQFELATDGAAKTSKKLADEIEKPALAVKAGAAAVGKVADDYDKLNKALQARLALANEELRLNRPLTELEKEMATLTRGYAEGTVKLTAAKFERLKIDMQGLKVLDQVIAKQKERDYQEKMQLAMINNINEALDKREIADLDNAEAAQKYAKAIEESNALTQIEFNTMGQTASQRTIAIEQYKIELELRNKILEIKKRLGNEDAQAAAIASVTQTAQREKLAVETKARGAEFMSVFESIDSTAHSTFVNVFEGGKNAFDKLRDTLKSGLLDLLYQMTIKKWIFNIGAAVTGGGISGAAQAASGAGGGFGGIGSGVGSMYTSFANSSIGASLGLSQAASTAAIGALDGTVASFAAAEAAATSTLPVLTSLGSTIGMAIPYIGLALGAVALISNLLDDGPEANTKLTFGSSANAVTNSMDTGRNQTGGNYVGGAGVNTAFGSYGVSDQFWIDAIASANRPKLDAFLQGVKASDAALASYLTTDEQARVKAALDNSTTVLSTGAEGSDPSAQYGVAFSDRIKSILNGVEDGLGAYIDGFTGAGEQLAAEAQVILAARKNIEQYAKVFGESVTLDQLAALKNESESVGGAITRLTAEFTLTNAIAVSLGKSASSAFGDLGLASASAREQLITLAGGIDKLQSGAAFFAQNFLTEAERLAPVQAQVASGLAELGLSAITTRDQFKAAVQALDLSSEAGRTQYVALMGLQQAFAEITPVIDAAAEAQKTANDLAKQASDLNIQIMELSGNAASALAAKRQIEMAALDASLQPLQARIYALQDEATVTAIAAQHRDLDIQLMEALGNAEGALAARRQDALGKLDAYSQGVQQQIWAAQDASAAIQKAQQSAAAETQRMDQEKQAAQQAYDQRVSAARSKLQEAYNREASALQGVISKMDGFADAARKLQNSLIYGDSSTLNASQKYASAKAGMPDLIARANAGDSDALGQLQQFVEISKASSANFIDYQRDFGGVIATLDQSAATAETASSIAKSQLSALKAQTDQIINVDKSVLTVADAIRELQVAMLGGLSDVATSVGGAFSAASAIKSANAINPLTGVSASTTASLVGIGAGNNVAYTNSRLRAYNQFYPPQAQQDEASSFVSGLLSKYDTSHLLNSMGGDATSPDFVIQSLKDAYIDSVQGGMSTSAAQDYITRSAMNAFAALPSFDVGTNYVPRDMLAQIHEGEAIVPKAYNPAASNSASGTGNTARLEALVEQLIDRVNNVAAKAVDQERFMRQLSPTGESINVKVVS